MANSALKQIAEEPEKLPSMMSVQVFLHHDEGHYYDDLQEVFYKE